MKVTYNIKIKNTEFPDILIQTIYCGYRICIFLKLSKVILIQKTAIINKLQSIQLSKCKGSTKIF